MRYQSYILNKLIESKAEDRVVDTLILCSGSDERTYRALSLLEKSNPRKVVILHYKERLENQKNYYSIFDNHNISTPNLYEVNCTVHDPSSLVSEFSRINLQPEEQIGLDITSMSKPFIFYIIKMLKSLYKVSKISVYYTEPLTYKFKNGIFANFKTNSDSLNVSEIPGYNGIEERKSQRKLIVLLGFDGDTAKSINLDVSPTSITVVNGFPAYSPKFKDISLFKNRPLIFSEESDTEILFARANNPFEVYNVLYAMKNNPKNSDIFFNIAPLGTKPMALGACMFALHYPDVRVVYPYPEVYDYSYSRDSWHTWCYQIPLTL